MENPNNNHLKFKTEENPILIFTERWGNDLFIQTMGHNGYISLFMSPNEAKRMAKYILYTFGELELSEKEIKENVITKCPMKVY